jgi:hypothetical protein
VKLDAKFTGSPRREASGSERGGGFGIIILMTFLVFVVTPLGWVRAASPPRRTTRDTSFRLGSYEPTYGTEGLPAVSLGGKKL